MGVVDYGVQSLELFNMLFSHRIAESRKRLMIGLEALQEEKGLHTLVEKVYLTFGISRASLVQEDVVAAVLIVFL